MSKTATKFVTPVGNAIYPSVITPDTKFDDNGQYKCDVLVPEADAQPLVDELTAIYKAHVGKAPKKSENSMFEEALDKETGESTGDIKFKIRIKNRISKKTGKLWDRQPAQVNRQGKLMPKDAYVDIGSGSKVRVGFEAYEWIAAGKKGVSLQLTLVQIIDLKERTGGAADPNEYGFGQEEGTFDEDEGETAEGFADESGDGDDNPDF